MASIPTFHSVTAKAKRTEVRFACGLFIVRD